MVAESILIFKRKNASLIKRIGFEWFRPAYSVDKYEGLQKPPMPVDGDYVRNLLIISR